MMSARGSAERSGIRKKPYALICQALLERARPASAGGVSEGAPHSSTPLQCEREEPARLFRRLGAIPRSWPAARALQAVPQVIGRMAADAQADPQDVLAAVLGFCADDGPTAVCSRTPQCSTCPIAAHCDHPGRRPTIKDLPTTERPRERLLQSGEEGLSDAELLAIIIGSGSEEETALELARRLLSRFGSFRSLAGASAGELSQVRGIGPAKAAQIKAALAIARRYAAERVGPGTAVTGSEQLFRYMREKLHGLKKESFYALMLDTKHRVIREEQVAVGSLNESIVHPREAFHSAIRESAAKIIFVHNHPSGNPEPSPQDRRLTARLCQIGNLVGIQVLDHLIVGDETYYSFAEHGLVSADESSA